MKFFLYALAVAFGAFIIVSSNVLGTAPPQAVNAKPASVSTCPATITSGQTGEPVATLQRALRKHGHSINVDGNFGTDTFQAVVTFQKQHRIQDNGIVNETTWRVLGRC